MSSYEIDTIACVANLIAPKLETRKAAWDAYMAIEGKSVAQQQADGKAYHEANEHLAIAVDLYLPIILSAVERAKEAA